MRLNFAFRGMGFLTLAAAAIYVCGSLYFHGSDSAAYQVLQDTGQIDPKGSSLLIVKLDYPWLIALRVANIASIVSAISGMAYIEWRTRLGLPASPLLSLPAVFAYSAFACLNDLILNTDITDLDLAGSGTNDEGHIEVILLLPLALFLAAALFCMAFGAKPTPVFARPPLLNFVGAFTVIASGFLLFVVGSEMITLACGPSYTNLIQPGSYPGLASVVFCAYNCLRIILGRAAAARR